MDIKKNNRSSPSKSTVISRGIDGVRGVIAQELERQFVEQGIVGQPLLTRKPKDDYFIYYIKSNESAILDNKLWYSFERDKQPELTELPDTYWAPAAIPKRAWDLALSRFSLHSTLADNIEKYLLTQFDSVLDLFSYDEIRSMVTQALLKEGILMQPVRIANRVAYYFDTDQVYKKDTAGRWETSGRIRHTWHHRKLNMRTFTKAASSFQVGSTLSDCVDLLLKTDTYTPLRTNAQYSPWELPVACVGPISYERAPENQNPKTVDFIRVQANFTHSVHSSWKELRQEVEQHQQEIDNLVTEQIKNDPSFQKLGLPINAFKLSNRVLSRSYFLEYIFDLKDAENSD